MRHRIVKKIGNSWFIRLNPIDLVDFALSEGDTLDIEDCLIVYHNAKKKRTSKGK